MGLRTMKRVGLMLALIGILIGSFSLASAATRDGADWDVGCEGFTSKGGGFVMDRDNTGEGREEFIITGRDGTGRTIFGPETEGFFVGGSVYIKDGITFEWTATPRANPLTVSVVSPAGNGVQEQVVYTARGTCSGLPDEVDVTTPTSGVTVRSETAITEPQPGYLLVNTYRLNVRSGDGAEYTIVGQVSGGTELAVLGVNEARTWWFIQANGLRGWVIDDAIINRGDLRDTPIVEADGEILPPRFFVFTRAPIYNQPRATSIELCEIPGNREYVIDRQNENGSWYGIEATCDGESLVGWIDAERGALRNLGGVEIPVLP